MKAAFVVCIVFVIAALNSCGGSSGTPKSNTASSSASSSTRPPHQYLGTIQSNLSITSAITGITYPYHVYLPHNYALSNKSYPIVYGTDAQ